MALDAEDKAWITGQLLNIEAKLEAKIEATETKLLTAFHDWASPVDARMRSHSAALRAFDAELEYITKRVSKLEGGAPVS